MKIKILADIKMGEETIKAGSIGYSYGMRVHFDKGCVEGLPEGEMAMYDLDFILTLPHELINKEG